MHMWRCRLVHGTALGFSQGVRIRHGIYPGLLGNPDSGLYGRYSDLTLGSGISGVSHPADCSLPTCIGLDSQSGEMRVFPLKPDNLLGMA
jgi:hypothetical protein